MTEKKYDDFSQSNKFIAAARELECDMTNEEFAEKLKGIAATKKAAPVKKRP